MWKTNDGLEADCFPSNEHAISPTLSHLRKLPRLLKQRRDSEDDASTERGGYSERG